MNVLFAIDIKTVSNPFVTTLCNGLRNAGVSVESGTEKFWGDTSVYNIVHFQWPEAVFSWRKSLRDNEVERFKQKIEELKKEGVKIALTCHNLKPHTITDKNVLSLYDIIYNNCDLFLHMGNYSLRLLKKTYPLAQHKLLPHHLYDRIYTFDKKQEECKKKLGIDVEKCCILCFGEFRTDEERQLVLNTRRMLKDEAYEFMLPGFYRKKILTKKPVELVRRCFYALYYKCIGIRSRRKFINTEETEQYFCAADIVLLQRVSILNSGNLPMAFAAGKVVVGPNVGNVGEILAETGNLTFNPRDIATVVSAVKEAKGLADKGKGKENKQYANAHWKTSIIARQLSEYYTDIVNAL